MNTVPLDLVEQFRRLMPLLDLLHVRQDMRMLYETIHAAGNSSGNENILGWLDALESQGKKVNDNIAIEIMRLMDLYYFPFSVRSHKEGIEIEETKADDGDQLVLCDVCGDREVRLPNTTCHICLRQRYIDEH